MSNDAGGGHFFQSKCAIFCVRSLLYCVGCSFYHSLFFFFWARQCPSEKSINLARGLANVRTIRQRADWWEGMDSRRVGGREGGCIRGQTCVRWTLQLRPTCNKAATILRARRAGWRGNLPTHWERDEGTTGMNPYRDSLQGASIVSIKVGAFYPTPQERCHVVFVPPRNLQSSF